MLVKTKRPVSKRLAFLFYRGKMENMVANHNTPDIILGSQSPRRQQLISLLGLAVSCRSVDADEESITDVNPAQNVVKTAALKTKILLRQLSPPPPTHTLLITADTTVALDGLMLNKPATPAEAYSMLTAMGNRTHEVHTGYVITDLQSRQQIQGVHTAVVTMRNYSHEEIKAYIATGDPMDKAGAYAIQHPRFRPVARLDGCFLSVMGLPLCDLMLALQTMAVAWPKALTAVEQAHRQMTCPIFPKIQTSLPK